MKRFVNLKTFFVVVLVLTIILVLVRLNQSNKPKYTVNLSSQTVIKQMRSLSRLETSAFTIEKIIDVGTSGNKFNQFLYGDRILLIAHGSVIAGFDMAKVSEENIEVDGTTLNLTMPAPEILVTKLDSEETRVYDRQQGVLTKGDQDLESTARAEAEEVIRDAACKGGILSEASKNARTQMTTLFKGLGFQTVVIEIPQGSC